MKNIDTNQIRTAEYLKNFDREKLLKYLILKDNPIIFDIGANDGTFLSYFNKKKYNRIGCEPAKNLQNVLKKNCDYVLNDFWEAKKLERILKKKIIKKAKSYNCNWNVL